MTRPRFDAAGFEALQGRSIAAWSGIEMAFVDGEDDAEPLFEDDALPLRQLMYVDLRLQDGDVVRVVTHQNDAAFGLSVAGGDADMAAELEGIFRWATLVDLPTGLVQGVRCRQEVTPRDSVVPYPLVGEVELTVAGRSVLLVAGEVYAGQEGRFVLGWLDESVLLFTDPGAADRLSWRPERGPVGVV
ncbi:hypothetical protein B7486_73450 [cyanobacterium TDX16]|nr:hypothetical protein B7486_73450 [cyanobacterium TDX16]